ncbi:MAG: hypothetical protein ACC646_13270, partial [Paracoccaceae bacterium]
IPQARAQLKTLDRRLLDGGLFAPLASDGTFGPATALDQAAVLWASASLISAATSEAQDYWHRAFADLTDPDDSRVVAGRAFAAISALPAQGAAARAITIEALGRYAAVAQDAAVKTQALKLARQHADALVAGDPTSLQDVALSIYGLVEAGRLLDDQNYIDTAMQVFRRDLMARWSDTAGVFVAPDGTAAYTPQTIGAVIAALNAVRWYGPDDQAAVAAGLYPVFFENAIVRSGLLRASPRALVSAKYLESRPAESFAHPALPEPAEAGVAAVFAAGARFENGVWSVTNPIFETGPAMFLANMLALQTDGQADTFLTDDQLQSIR